MKSKAGKILETLQKRQNSLRRSLVESPVKINQELLLIDALGSMSEFALNQRYQLLGTLERENKYLKDVKVYYSRIHNHFRAGVLEKSPDEPISQLAILTQIDSNDRKFVKIEEIQGLKNPYQIGLVQTRDSNIGQGIAKSLYLFLIRIGYDLISDCEQYLGGYWLWKSLSRSDRINVYAWDDLKKDYIKDSTGKAIRYDGSNIPEDLIWSDDEAKLHTVLVSTSRKL